MTVPVVSEAERVRVRRAVALLEAAADEVAAVAVRVATRSAAADWSGPARGRHDDRATAVAADLRAVAGSLRDVAADAGHALAVAVRRAEDQAASAAAATAGLGDGRWSTRGSATTTATAPATATVGPTSSPGAGARRPTVPTGALR